MKASDILQSKGVQVYGVSASATVADAVQLLNSENIGAVIVHDTNKKLIGILSERDVVRKIGADGAKVLSDAVTDIMTADPFTCGPETELDAMLAKMTDKRIRHLPIVDAGQVIGVISIGDVVKRKIENAEQEAQALKDYISA